MGDCPSSKTDLLLRRAQDGDQLAQAALLEHYRDRLRRMVTIRIDKRVTARVDPSDVVQEALKDAHRRLPEYFADPQLSLRCRFGSAVMLVTSHLYECS